MMLIERTAVPDAALPVAELRAHLRLGTGFSDVGAEDAALLAYLRAALAAIEGRTAKVLMARAFTVTLEHWRGDGPPLPVAPVTGVTELRLIDGAGGTSVLGPERYRLAPDGMRPRVIALGWQEPGGAGAAVEIDFTAGFGTGWSDVPADLRQAVLLLAAQYYELRHDGGAERAAMPFGVIALIERWRTVRVLGGRG